MKTNFYDEQTQKEAAIAAQAMQRAIQIKPLDKCLNDAAEISAMAAKAAEFAEAISERIGGPMGGEASRSAEDERCEPMGALGKLSDVQGGTLARLRRLFRALEQLDALA